MANGVPRLSVPGQLQVTVAAMDNGRVAHACAALVTPNGMQVIAVGGMSKLEHVATQLMAGMLAADDGNGGYVGLSHAELAKHAVQAAQALLAECAKADAKAGQGGLVAGEGG